VIDTVIGHLDASLLELRTNVRGATEQLELRSHGQRLPRGTHDKRGSIGVDRGHLGEVDYCPRRALDDRALHNSIE
jgi:hypothetical protein